MKDQLDYQQELKSDNVDEQSIVRTWIFGLTKFFVAALLILGGFGLSQAPTQAQSPIPNGSYSRSCYNVSYNGSTLTALCHNGSGQYNWTNLYYANQCRSDIANRRGYLQCNNNPVYPDGSYSQSCYEIRLIGSSLRAVCSTGSGQYRSTYLNYWWNCGEIANRRGFLRCE